MPLRQGPSTACDLYIPDDVPGGGGAAAPRRPDPPKKLVTKRTFETELSEGQEDDILELQLGEQRITFVVTRLRDNLFEVIAEGQNVPEEATLTEALIQKLSQ